MSLTNTLKLGVASSLTLLLSTSAYAGETLGLDDVPGAQEYLLAVPGATVEDAIQAMSPDNLQKVDAVYDCVSKLSGFAGFEARHLPFRVVVKFKRRPGKTLSKCTNDKSFQAVGAARSLQDLEFIKDRATGILNDSGIRSEASINLRRNRVEVEVLESDRKNANKALRKRNGRYNRGIRFVTVSAFGPVVTADLRAGGAGLTAQSSASSARGICTSGFNVTGTDQSGVFRRGGSTANHCGRQVRYDRNAGFFASASNQTGLGPDENNCNYDNPAGLQRTLDLQWFFEPGDTYSNFIEGDAREVVSVFRQADLLSRTGFPVCISGQRFGNIPSRPGRTTASTPVTLSQGCVIPSFPASNTQPAISNSPQITCGVADFPISSTRSKARIIGATQNNQFVQGGDSGGPVFSVGRFTETDIFGNVISQRDGLIALGNTIGFSSREFGVLTYGPIENYDRLGLTVITR